MEDVLSIIEELENVIESASGLPLTDKVLVDKDELLEYIKQIRIELPEELKKAAYINDNRERILVEAQEEADIIVKEAEDRILSLVDEDDITRKANYRAEEIIVKAKEDSVEIRLGSLEYADEVLEGIEENLNRIIGLVQENREELKSK